MPPMLDNTVGNMPEQTESAKSMSDADFEVILEKLREGDKLEEIVKANSTLPDPLAQTFVLKVRNLLGISKQRWAAVSDEALRDYLPRFGMVKITSRISLNMAFNTLEQMLRAIEVGREIMESKDKAVEAQTRIMAGSMITKAGEAIAKMMPQIQELAISGSDKSEQDENKPKYKNLPPQLNVQVNVGGPTSPGSPTPLLPPAISVSSSATNGTGKNSPPAGTQGKQ